MIIPLDKLVSYEGNRYMMTRAAMAVVDRIDALKDLMVEGEEWKIVPNVLKLMLEGEVKFEYNDK
ncbi:MAG: hypothetical protein N2316_05165 [Spirochaetes bacterium]|nr:hypothetical protein [Spirochaetota bacterium]